jgi:inner membrane protein
VVETLASARWRWCSAGGEGLMLTAHLPSGYLLARSVRHPVAYMMPAALIGAMLPDADMLWFHFVDHGSVHHHYYWPHIPAIWAGIALVTLPILQRFGLLATGVVFYAAIFLHLILDTIAGGINWAWPIGHDLFALTEVPAAYSHWVISFILHWTFLAELAIWALALWLYFGKKTA